MGNKIYSICWNITGKCNENCKFCYRTVTEDLCVEKNKQIAQILVHNNVSKITFAGGEPLLYPDLFELANYIRRLNTDIFLSITTNGKLVDEEMIAKILQHFNAITLSIDGCSALTHSRLGRGSEHLQKNLWILKLISGKTKIKINSVATRENINEFSGIKILLAPFSINRWKIMRFYPISYIAKTNQADYQLSDREFLMLKKTLISPEGSSMRIEFSDINEFEKSYISIYPNGDMHDGYSKIVGNLLTQSLDECLHSIDFSEHTIRKISNANFAY